MSTDYHGKKPVTKADVKMAKKHLKATEKLVKSKIKDHQKAMKSTSNPGSKSYNQAHLSRHRKEDAKLRTSLRTVSKLHPKV